MLIEFDFITGFMVGLEFFENEAEGEQGLILDLGIIRLIFYTHV